MNARDFQSSLTAKNIAQKNLARFLEKLGISGDDYSELVRLQVILNNAESLHSKEANKNLKNYLHSLRGQEMQRAVLATLRKR